MLTIFSFWFLMRLKAAVVELFSVLRYKPGGQGVSSHNYTFVFAGFLFAN
jgi:hypothetical protein